MLQAGSQWTFLHLDREKFELFIVDAGSNRIGAQQRFTVHFKADHDELAALEAETLVTRGAEGKQPVGPVVNVKNGFLIKIAAHLRNCLYFAFHGAHFQRSERLLSQSGHSNHGDRVRLPCVLRSSAQSVEQHERWVASATS